MTAPPYITRRCLGCRIEMRVLGRGRGRQCCDACLKKRLGGNGFREENAMTAAEVDAYLHATVQRETALAWERRPQ